MKYYKKEGVKYVLIQFFLYGHCTYIWLKKLCKFLGFRIELQLKTTTDDSHSC